MINITAAQLTKIARPHRANKAILAHLVEDIPEVLPSYGIETPLRVSHFIPQICHESGGFRALEENLNYSARGLMLTFGKHFKNRAEAKLYERQPEKIANRVYANRNGNGNEASGDGWRYRGRGYIMLTGKYNYRKYGRMLGVDLVNFPGHAAEPRTALHLACLFWTESKLNRQADHNDILTITRRINGGTNGLADRKKKFNKAWSIWGQPSGRAWISTQPVLRIGRAGSAVRLLQRKLKITVDGIFGPATVRAVRAFQRRNRLNADGIVGPATWKILK